MSRSLRLFIDGFLRMSLTRSSLRLSEIKVNHELNCSIFLDVARKSQEYCYSGIKERG